MTTPAARAARPDIYPLPTSAALLRRNAILARQEAESAQRWADRCADRADDKEAEADAAERGIAPPGFCLVDP